MCGQARDTTASTPRVWMKSAMVERELGKVDAQRELLQEGIVKFPFFAKLWLMMGQLEQTLDNTEAARSIYRKGVGRCIASLALWKYVF